MKAKQILISGSLVTSSILLMSISAQAASFTTNVSQKSDPTQDIFLQSVEQNGKTITNFSFVKSAEIIKNDLWTGKDTGAASTDRGDNASVPLNNTLERQENPRDNDIAAYLGNNNLNNIIDTEDNGAFDINIFFDSVIKADKSGLDNLFFWERGWKDGKGNSDLEIQALDASGNTISNPLKLFRNNQTSAGFSIDTREISGSQIVGSWGVNLSDLGVTELNGLRIKAYSSFNGPDFKVVARKNIPEPGMIAGLGTVATVTFLLRRQQKQVES
jgi:hypothetical protein